MNDKMRESPLTTGEAFESLTQQDMELIALKATVEQQVKLIESYRKDAERYRFISQLAWYVDKAAYIYDVGNQRAVWSDERLAVDADDIEAAIDAAMGQEVTP